jgi:AcrR family transcriptional regulator
LKSIWSEPLTKDATTKNREATSDTNRDNTREIILVAALETLADVGYSRLRTATVSAKAGLSEGSLFHHFPSKVQLVAAATERAFADIARSAAESYANVDLTDIRLLLRKLFDILVDKKVTWLNELFAATCGDPQLDACLAPIIGITSDIVDALAASVVRSTGLVPEAEVVSLAAMVVLSMQGLISRELARGESGLEAELIDYLTFVLESMYAAGPSSS